MRNYYQKGDAPDVVFPIAAKAGDGVLIGPGLFGVANIDCAAGEQGPATVVGVFSLPKADPAIVSGAKAYWDNNAKRVTAVAAGNTHIGAFTLPSPAGASNAYVRLNGAIV